MLLLNSEKLLNNYRLDRDGIFGNFGNLISLIVVFSPILVSCCGGGSKSYKATVGVNGSTTSVTTSNQTTPVDQSATNNRQTPSSPNFAGNGTCGLRSPLYCNELTGENCYVNVMSNDFLAVEPARYPWLVQIAVRNDVNLTCSAVVINALWLLTSKPCLFNNDIAAVDQPTDFNDYYEAWLPVATIDGRPDSYVLARTEVVSIINHPQAPVSLVKLSEPMNLNSWRLQPICLPSSCSNDVCEPNSYASIIESQLSDPPRPSSNRRLVLQRTSTATITNNTTTSSTSGSREEDDTSKSNSMSSAVINNPVIGSIQLKKQTVTVMSQSSCQRQRAETSSSDLMICASMPGNVYNNNNNNNKNCGITKGYDGGTALIGLSSRFTRANQQRQLPGYQLCGFSWSLRKSPPCTDSSSSSMSMSMPADVYSANNNNLGITDSSRKPEVFTRICKIINWIKSMTSPP